MDKLINQQLKLDSARALLAGTEHWEFIDDDKSLGFMSPKFIAYRQSGAYRLLKMLRQELDGNACTKCGDTKNLHFHHLTYKRLFKELLTDGRTLCTVCHNAGHKTRRDIFNLSTNKEITMLTGPNGATVRDLGKAEKINILRTVFNCYFDSKNPRNPSQPCAVATYEIVGNRFGLSKGQVKKICHEHNVKWDKKDTNGNKSNGYKSLAAQKEQLVDPATMYFEWKGGGDRTEIIEDAIQIATGKKKSDRFLPANKHKFPVPTPQIPQQKLVFDPQVTSGVVIQKLSNVTDDQHLMDCLRVAKRVKSTNPELVALLLAEASECLG